MKNTRILGIIPARKGSKRVPNKNTRILAGRPLIEHALNAAIKCNLFHSLVVSSDDEQVEVITRPYREVQFIRRPPELATDEAPAIEYVNHAISTLSVKWDIIVIIQPTSPFVSAEDIEGTIKLLLETGADSAVSVMKVEQMVHPFKLKVMRGKLLTPFLVDEGGIKQAHDLPAVFSRNGAVYATTEETIQRGKIVGERCAGFIMPRERSIDINDPIDFEFAEFLAKRNQIK